jgi:nucleoside-diphosphate-sugar epimerase
MKHIILTGAGGMLGREILRQCSFMCDTEIYAISSQADELRIEFSDDHNIHIFDSVSFLPSLGVFVVINCAFPRISDGKALVTAMDNTLVTLDALAEKGIVAFINISTQSVYSQYKIEIPDESFSVAPRDLYGLAKYSTERLLILKQSITGIKVVNVRLSSLISPDFDQRMINRFYDKLLRNQDILIEEGNTKISFMEISDAAKALLKMATMIDKSSHNIYNLGNSDWLSLSSIAHECFSYYENRARTDSKLIIRNTGSLYNNVVDSSRFNSTFSYRAECGMLDIISQIGRRKIRGDEFHQ